MKSSVHASMVTPTHRDLIFDIDMDDYDEIRNSEQGKKISDKSWPFLKGEF